METNLDQVAKEIYGKIQTRFPGIKIADEKAEVLSKKEDIPKARFFEFEYKENGEALGTISINLDQEEGIVIQVSGDLTDDDEETTHHGAFKFIRSFRKFARQHLLNYEVDRMGKSSLDKRDYEFHAKSGEEPMTESKMWGTPRVSYQDLGETRLVVKHSKPVNYDLAAGRTMHIESIYIENKLGERFRYPVRHLNGARAMAQHIGHGGNPYDSIGQHVVSLSEELSKLRMFKGYVSRTPVVSESMSTVNDKVIERIEQVKKEIHQLQQSKHYEEFAESFSPYEAKEIPEEIMLDWVDRLTVRSFKEELKDVFPYIYKLVDESEIPTKELNPDDLLDEETLPWETDDEAKEREGGKKDKSPFKKPNNPNRTGRDAAKALAQKGIPKKEKAVTENGHHSSAKQIHNKKGRLLGTWDGRTFTIDPEFEVWANEELGHEWVKQFLIDKNAELKKHSAPSIDRIKYHANELEKSDVQAGRPRQSRQAYHDLAVKMLSDHHSVTENKKSIEDQFESFLNQIVNEDEADALDGNPESIQALKTFISQGKLVGDPNRVDGLTANGLDVNRYPELQQLFDLTSPNDDSWPSVKAWMDKENPEISKEIFAGSEYSGEEGEAETPPPTTEVPAGAEETPAGAEETPAGAEETPAGAEETPAGVGEVPAMEGKERAKTSVLNAIRKGAKPDTKVGSKTLHDIMTELGMDPEDPAAKDIAPPVKPHGKSYKDMKAFANGWWNKEKRNFTIGGGGVKTKIENQFRGADPKDLERIFANIDRADPPSKIINPEQGRIKELAGVNASGQQSPVPQHGTINESLSIIRKLSGLK